MAKEKSLTRKGAIGILRACPPRYNASSVEPVFHYVVVRADLPRGIQAANIIHASGESSPGNLSPGTHAVCLVVPDEQALRGVATKLEAHACRFAPIVETDAPFDGQLMAIGCVPAGKEVLKRALSALPLLR